MNKIRWICALICAMKEGICALAIRPAVQCIGTCAGKQAPCLDNPVGVCYVRNVR